MIQALLFYLQGIPEIAGIVACGLALARVKLRWGVILVVAGALAVVIYIIRSMPVTFGLHTVAAILLCTIFIARFTRVPPSLSFTVVFASSAIMAFLELTVYKLFAYLHQDSSRLIANDYTWMWIGLPQAFIMIAIALAIAKYCKPQDGMWKI